MEQLEHSFKVLGEWVTVESNSMGSMLRVSYGDQIISESHGECLSFKGLEFLSGAAQASAINNRLRKAGESALSDALYDMADIRNE